LQAIAALKEKAGNTKVYAERARLLKKVEQKRLEFNLMMERQKRQAKT
jgi:hypothetical protein